MSMKPGILVSSPDLRHSFVSILKGLDEASLLKLVVTTIAIDPDRILGKCIKAICKGFPAGYKTALERRFLPDFLRGKTHTLYSREILRLLAHKVGNESFANRVWLWAELGFDRRVAEQYGGLYHCVYGMEHSSLETFTRQKELSGLCILRQVGQHVRRVVDVVTGEINKFPEYAGSYSKLFRNDMERALLRKESEYRLADLIVVNSPFVRETFIQFGVGPERVVAIPTGCPSSAHITFGAGKGQGPLIFLFVGNLSLHKGLPYLIQAWNLLKPDKHAQLWLVGAKRISRKIFEGRDADIRYFGVLSRSDLEKIYLQADVLVLPTLLEGLAYVVLEALSYGLPVITTNESGCADFVRDGENGFIIEAANPESLSQAMAWCLKYRSRLPDMGEVSLKKARSWTVTDSNRIHLKAIQDFLKKI